MNKTEDGWRLFLSLIHHVKSSHQLEELFTFLLTIEEQKNLATRCLLVKELLENKKPQREIADEFKVSLSTLTRGSNALKIISGNLRRYLEDNI